MAPLTFSEKFCASLTTFWSVAWKFSYKIKLCRVGTKEEKQLELSYLFFFDRSSEY
jgi:hypothetical protein